MLRTGTGNLLESDVVALVNTVNCVGVMGKGIALQFKQAFPENFKKYKEACDAGEVQLGRMLVFKTESPTNPAYIVNFPTKKHWKEKSQLSHIQTGLLALVEELRIRDIKSIAIPPLGCGNGGLLWQDVEPLIQAAFSTLPSVEVMVFSPDGAPAPKDIIVRTEKPNMTLGRALLISLIKSYREQDYELTKLEIQKLAYFAQMAGQPLKLNFVRDKFGPYAENLNHALQAMEGHFIQGCGDRNKIRGRSKNAEISLLLGAYEEAEKFLAADVDSLKRINKVSELIQGFETPYAMELLATVHVVASGDARAAEEAKVAIAEVHRWSDYKKNTFSPEHILIAWEHLRAQGWLT